MSALVGAHVRIEWPDHPTHGRIGQVLAYRNQTNRYAVELECDQSVRVFKPEHLKQVKQVLTWVDV
jgi:ribosomal protein L21E